MFLQFLKKFFYKNRPDYRLYSEIKLITQSRFPLKENYLPNHKSKISGINITKDIVIKESNLNTVA